MNTRPHPWTVLTVGFVACLVGWGRLPDDTSFLVFGLSLILYVAQQETIVWVMRRLRLTPHKAHETR